VAVKKTAKKSAKKTSAKKTSAKKTSAKKSAKKVVKKTAKKSAVKKSAKKVVKKSAKKTAKKASSTFVVPSVPSTRSGYQSTSVVNRPAKTPGASVPSGIKSSSNDASSKRVVIAVVIAVVVLALIVVSRNGSTSNETAAPEATATAQASEGSSEEATTEATPEASSSTVVDGGGSEPVGIVAQYTASGATIFWKTPLDGASVANYNVEIRANGGTWKLISTVPADQYSIDITKGDATGWASFRISSVLEDGTVVGGKVFGLPGQWS
jgi:hypothetical protein